MAPEAEGVQAATVSDTRWDEKKVVDGFEEVLLAAVNRRLRADVPVVSYLSGGVDSSLVVAMANKALGRPIPTFGDRTPGLGGTSMVRMPTARMIAAPCSGPAPPKMTRAKSRGS